MIMSERKDDHDDIVWHGGVGSFRGLAVEERRVQVAGMEIRIAAMADATQLLDQADCAKRFLDADVAPYGVELWPAAIMLAEYIAATGLKPHRTLEIGCGLGLVSIVAAKLGWEIAAGDHEPSALIFAQYNARLNATESIKFIEFDWNQPPEPPRYDCILGADILYQLNNHAPVVNCIDKLLAPGGVALISDPNRGVADRFPAVAKAAGFRVECTPVTAENPSKIPAAARIFRLFRP